MLTVICAKHRLETNSFIAAIEYAETQALCCNRGAILYQHTVDLAGDRLSAIAVYTPRKGWSAAMGEPKPLVAKRDPRLGPVVAPHIKGYTQ